MRRWTWLICGGLMLGPVTLVAAGDGADPYPTCTKQPSPGDQEAAQGAFKAGFGSYQEGDYPKAIMYWSDAYTRDCTAHALLLNLANAYERMGDKKATVVALEVYLERAKDLPNRPQLEKRLEKLKEQIASEAAATPAPDAGTTTQPTTDAAPTTTAPASTVEVKPGGGKSIAPWIVVGAGGALTIVGALVYVGGASKVKDSEDICPDRVCPRTTEGAAAQKDGEDGRKQMTIGGVVAGVGLAGVAGGLVWEFAFNKPSTDGGAAKTPAVHPTFGPDYAGVTFGGNF